MTDKNTGYDDRVQSEKPGTNDPAQTILPGTSPSDPAVSPDFYIPMTPDDISSLAAKNEKPRQGMTAIDWLLWYMLRDVYREFKQGILDKDAGAERKRQALDIWERETAKDQRNRDTVNRAVTLWRTVESAASEYRKNRTLENADRVMTAIYGIPCGDPPCHDERNRPGGPSEV